MSLHLNILDQSPVSIGHMPARAVIGDLRRVRKRLLQLRERFDAGELMIPNVTGDYASRPRSYELLAREFELQ